MNPRSPQVTQLRTLRDAWQRSGWTPGRQIPTHMVRAMLIGADFRAWPAALEILAEFGGLTIVLPKRTIDFDLAFWLPETRGEHLEDWCPVGRTSRGDWVQVDMDGRILCAGENYESMQAYWLTLVK